MTDKRGIFDLTGKNVLITGPTGGLGEAIAEGFAEFGADLVLVARNLDKLNLLKDRIEQKHGRSVYIKRLDLLDLDLIPLTFRSILDEVGSIDVLVNCAGINIRAKAEDVSLEDWRRVLDVNLTAAFLLSQQFCRHRRDLGGGGKIINIGSLMCKVARPTTSPYCASKGGLAMLTKALAVEWAKYDINVNAIGPGYFLTEMTEHLAKDSEFDEWVIKSTPLGRWGRPKDLVGVAIFLASPASDFITGQIIYVDGGWLANA